MAEHRHMHLGEYGDGITTAAIGISLGFAATFSHGLAALVGQDMTTLLQVLAMVGTVLGIAFTSVRFGWDLRDRYWPRRKR